MAPLFTVPFPAHIQPEKDMTMNHTLNLFIATLMTTGAAVFVESPPDRRPVCAATIDQAGTHPLGQ